MAKNKSKKGNKGNKNDKSKTPKIERNWEELGLMMGLEIHQQLNTKHILSISFSVHVQLNLLMMNLMMES